jgi:similar to spore coat protein
VKEMSWINNFLNDDNNDDKNNNTSALADKEIALDMLTTSKADISMLSKAITETINPQLRQILSNQINSSINNHFNLSDLVIQKGWYKPYENPITLVKQDVQEVQTMSNNQ